MLRPTLTLATVTVGLLLGSAGRTDVAAQEARPASAAAVRAVSQPPQRPAPSAAEESEPSQPEPSRRRAAPRTADSDSNPFEAAEQARTRQPPSRMLLLASAPPMWGDRFGGGGLMVDIQPPPMTFAQLFNDGSPFPLLVTSASGTPGASMDPTQPIMVFNAATGELITTSIGPGIDGSGDQFPDTFQINDPASLLPAAPGPGVFVFDGGTAVFVGVTGPNTQTMAADRTGPQGWNLAFSHTFIPNQITVLLPEGGGDGIRRLKIGENNSPQPRDRVYFNYSFFNDVIGGFGDVNRYTAGIEKTFLCGCASVDVRFPFAGTLSSNQTVGGTNLTDAEVGNLTVILKLLLSQNERMLLSGGVGFTTPTASDTRLFDPAGRQLLAIDNETLRVMPYLALLSTPNRRWFFQSFVQLDLTASGNPVRADLTGTRLTEIGVLEDAALFIADVGFGYRLFENPCCGMLTGLTPFAELHYTTTLEDSDVVSGGGFAIHNVANRYDNLNLTVGASFRFGRRLSIAPALVVPLRNDLDEEFDYEAGVQSNLRF